MANTTDTSMPPVTKSGSPFIVVGFGTILEDYGRMRREWDDVKQQPGIVSLLCDHGTHVCSRKVLIHPMWLGLALSRGFRLLCGCFHMCLKVKRDGCGACGKRCWEA